MSECVVRMEMPKDCPMCPMSHWNKQNEFTGCEVAPGKLYEMLRSKEYRDSNTRPNWCPIICQLPEGHGDLVDWKDVEKELDKSFCSVVDDGPCMGPYMLKRKEHPQALIERPIRVNIIVPAEAERSET